MTYTFLFVDLALLLVSFALLIDRHAFTLKMMRASLIPALVVTIIYSEIGVFMAGNQLWQFTPQYLIGPIYRNLPLEAYLYYFTFSLACINGYQYLNAKFKAGESSFSLFISNLMLGVSIAILFFAYSKWYTLLFVLLLLILLVLVEYRSRLRFMPRFYRAALGGLLLFYPVQAVLSNVPLVTYKWDQTMNAPLFQIPFENHFQYLGMFLLGVFVFEVIQSRRTAK